MDKTQTVIITGAANGIGRGIATHFAKEGHHIVLADNDTVNGKLLEDNLQKEGHPCMFVETDVKKEDEIIRLVEFTIQKYGKIDVVVNNAGISKFKPLFELSVVEWDEIIQTNLRSTFIMSREAARFMKNDGGVIINIASSRAFMSEPNTEGYSVSKGGIVALTHALAASLSPYHIRVNSISPGWIHTGDVDELSNADHAQHWSGRVGKPSDIASLCLFLADERNDFITGQNFTVDGGMTKKMIYTE